MNCKKAQNAVMQYTEGRLAPEKARELALHTMQCAGCREFYILMDENAETEKNLAASDVTGEIPADFTQAVMARVAALPAFASARPRAALGEILLRVLWGIAGIVMGVGMLLVLNPEWAASAALFDAFAHVQAFAAQGIERAAQAQGISALVNTGLLGIAALVFAGLIAGLLYGLHRGDNANNSPTGLQA